MESFNDHKSWEDKDKITLARDWVERMLGVVAADYQIRSIEARYTNWRNNVYLPSIGLSKETWGVPECSDEFIHAQKGLFYRRERKNLETEAKLIIDINDQIEQGDPDNIALAAECEVEYQQQLDTEINQFLR